MRWVAKCGKVGYTAFEGSLAAQTDFAEYCGEVCKGGEPGCRKPADPPKDPHYTMPEGVIKSRIEGRWYRVAACGDEAKEDYDTTTNAYADLVKHCADCRERKDDCWKTPVEHTPASIPNKAVPKPAAEEKRIGDDLFIREGIISLIPMQVKAKRNDGNNYSALTGCYEEKPDGINTKTEEEARKLLVAKCEGCNEKRRNCWKSLIAPVPPKMVPGAAPGVKDKEIIEIKPGITGKEPEKGEITAEKLLDACRYIRDQIKADGNNAQRTTKFVAEKVKEDQRNLTKALTKLYGRAPSSSSGKESFKYWSKAVLPKVEAAITKLEAKIAPTASSVGKANADA